MDTLLLLFQGLYKDRIADIKYYCIVVRVLFLKPSTRSPFSNRNVFQFLASPDIFLTMVTSFTLFCFACIVRLNVYCGEKLLSV